MVKLYCAFPRRKGGSTFLLIEEEGRCILPYSLVEFLKRSWLEGVHFVIG